MQLHTAAKTVKNEAHRFLEFIRFSRLEGGVYFSEIEPKYNVLPLLARHFAERFLNTPWMIYDSKRRLCLVFDGECRITEAEGTPQIKYSEDEFLYRSLWKKFYDAIEIKQRHNEKCRSNHMPKRFWKHITEMNPHSYVT